MKGQRARGSLGRSPRERVGGCDRWDETVTT